MIWKRLKRQSKPIEWVNADDVRQDIRHIVKTLGITHIDPSQIHCVRSHGSVSRAIARIWSLPRIWRQVLKIQPQYVIEVVSHYYDKLKDAEKKKTLIHELMHIPKNFSGALVSHRGRFHRIDYHSVDKLYQIYLANLKEKI